MSFEMNIFSRNRSPVQRVACETAKRLRGVLARVCLFAILFVTLPARAGLTGPETPPRTEPTPEELQGISVREHLNTQIPLDLSFIDEQNQPVKLRQYFNGTKPVLIQLGYYKCPMLCDLVSQSATKALKEVKTLSAGKDFEFIFISIDPHEDPSLAQKKKFTYMLDYDRPGSQDGWHFLTGGQTQITEIAKAVGFDYKWVASAQQYAHPAVVALATPQGKLARYLYYGEKLDERTLRLSLVEASDGKIGSAADHWILRCFVFDGTQGKYSLSAMRLMRLGGVLTVIVMGVVMVRLFRRDARRNATQVP
jgi:protein SCO1/2